MQSAITLLPYQKKSFFDRSQFKALFWARGCRKTFTVTHEIVDATYEAEAKGGRDTWIMVSRGDRQALENLQTAKSHIKAYSIAASEIQELELWSDMLGKTVKGREIVFPRGSRIISLPPVPDVLRGYTANYYLDEFDILALDLQEQIWRSVFPALRGYKRAILSSTGFRKGSMFYQIVEGSNGDGVWNTHKVDIYEAVKQGLPFDIEFNRKALGDEDGWAQEYELKWLDEASAWLSYDLIATCECEIDQTGDSTWNPLDRHETYIGWDVARRRDLSILWVLRKIGDVFVTRQIVNMRNLTFKAQREYLDHLVMRYNPRRIAVDQTGMGEVITEQLQDFYGKYHVEGVLFTGAIKQDLATLVKQKFEDRLLRIPAEKDIRDSLHSIKKTITAAGNSRFDAERSEATGHGDYFWSLALALHAADKPMSYEFAAGEDCRVSQYLDQEYSESRPWLNQ